MLFGTTPHAYITEFDGDAVSIIDVNRNTIQKIFGFTKPHVVRVTHDGTAAYVGDANNNIYKIETMTHTITKISTLSSHPIAFCILPDSSQLYAITNAGTLGVVDLKTNSLIKEITGLSGPQDIRATPDGKFVYVSNKKNGTLSVIQTSDQTFVKTISGMRYPLGLVFTIDGDFLYVSDTVSDCVYVIQTADNTLVKTILGLSNPKYIVMSPKKNTAYIANGGNDTVSILRLSDNFITGAISIPNPSAMAITSDSTYLYIASDTDDVLKVNTLDGKIDRVFGYFSNPTNIFFTDNNAPPDTVNGWQVITDPEKPYNQVTWNEPYGQPYQYRIYEEARYKNLIVTVPSTSQETYIYNDLNCIAGQTYAYYVIADYSNGFSSTIGSITITPERIGLAR